MITALSAFFPALLLRWIYGYDCLEDYVFGENITRTGTIWYRDRNGRRENRCRSRTDGSSTSSAGPGTTIQQGLKHDIREVMHELMRAVVDNIRNDDP